MPHICKITVYLFYLSTLQFTAAFGIMTGKKLELAKATRTPPSPVISDQETLSKNPTLTALPENIVPNNAKRIMAVTQVFALEEDEEPCEVSDSSTGNKRAFNCTSSSRISPRAKRCGLNAGLVGGYCVCNEGYRKFPLSDTCVKEKGQACKFQSNDCNTDLTNMACMNNVCSCEDSDVYDPLTSRCVGKVDGLCYPGIKECTLNAECVNVPTTATTGKRIIRRDASSSGYYYYQADQIPLEDPDYVLGSGSDIELSGRCQCKEGYVESQGGLCKKAYGQSCTSGYECDSLHLVCKEGICSCPDSLQIYDLVSKACRGLVGSTCTDEPGRTMCVKFAFCQKQSLKMDGKCTCLEDAVETNIRTCTRASLPISSMFLDDKHESASSNRVLFEV